MQWIIMIHIAASLIGLISGLVSLASANSGSFLAPLPRLPVTTEARKANLMVALQSSPIGQYFAGERRQGVYNFNDPFTCRTWALRWLYENQEPQVREKVRLLGDNDLVWDKKQAFRLQDVGTAKNLINYWITALNNAQNLLVRSGDQNAASHFVCIGLGEFASPNAESLGAGYIVFDPQVFWDTNHNPERSAYSMDAIAMHEFAHQLQYWTDEPALKDTLRATGTPYPRRTELQADCAAAALLAMIQIPIIGRNWESEKSGVAAAVKAVGDSELLSRTHHGTKRERELAADFGLQLTEKFLQSHLTTTGFTSTFILNSCRNFIDSMDRLYGNPWPNTAILSVSDLIK